jgi:cysteine desulfuration protein SufE
VRVTAVPPALADIIDAFQSVDPQTRLELLLDYSKRLPPLPERLAAERDAGEHRVHECMTPVFLWIERDNGALHIHADVAEEAPTVKGFVSILVAALEGASPDEAREIPSDLIEQLGLHDVIRMNRMVGLTAILARIRREASA